MKRKFKQRMVAIFLLFSMTSIGYSQDYKLEAIPYVLQLENTAKETY